MTRKDYVATAEILNGFKDLIGDQFVFEDLVDEFSLMFETDNEELTNKLRNENKKLNEALQINQRLLGVLNTTKEKYS